MIHRSVGRAGAATLAVAAACLAVLSCNVYDSSLLGNSASGASGASAGAVNAGTSGSAGHAGTGTGTGTGTAGASGTAGVPTMNGGDSGAAGTPDEGGNGGTVGGTAGSGGTLSGGGAGSGGTLSGGGAGSGGTAGTVAGSGGTVGTVAGSGGTAGTAGGAAGTAGTGGAATATGCAKLSVPIKMSTDRAHFLITLPANVDMTVGTVSMRLYVAGGTGGTVFSYVQDPAYHYFGVTTAARPEISSYTGWSTATWDVGAQPDTGGASGIVKTTIKRVGIEINALPDAAWTDPTVIYIDSMTVTTPTVSYTFNLDNATTVTSTASTTDAAPQVMWLNSGTSDTKATGCTLTWQATCP